MYKKVNEQRTPEVPTQILRHFCVQKYVYNMYKMYFIHVESQFLNSQWTCP